LQIVSKSSCIYLVSDFTLPFLKYLASGLFTKIVLVLLSLSLDMKKAFFFKIYLKNLKNSILNHLRLNL
ncbi:MAG: hypothetical protein ACRCZO_15445, partial [Cetobacterium sp.]